MFLFGGQWGKYIIKVILKASENHHEFFRKSSFGNSDTIRKKTNQILLQRTSAWKIDSSMYHQRGCKNLNKSFSQLSQATFLFSQISTQKRYKLKTNIQSSEISIEY